MSDTNAQQEDSLRKLLVDFTSDIPVIGVGEARDILEEELEKYVSKEKRAAQERLLDDLERETELEWYLRNENNENCNPQESGEANVAAIVRDFIASGRQALGEEQ